MPTRIHRPWLALVGAALVLSARAGYAQSQFKQLGSDFVVTGGGAVLTANVTLSTAGTLFVSADGTFAPTTPDSTAASMTIYIDGQQAGNDSLIDWRGSQFNVQHPFNVVGAKFFAAGPHTVQLVAAPLAGQFIVRAGANLSVMKSHATQVTQQMLGSDWGNFDFTSRPSYHAHPSDPALPVPHAPVLSSTFNGTEDVVLLGSGRSFSTGNFNDSGDAMWGLFSSTNGSVHDLGTQYAAWTVNDLQANHIDIKRAEVQAPMYTHGFVPASAFCGHSSTLSLDVSELPWDPVTGGAPEDGVKYSIGAGARLVALTGGMQVRGSAPITSLVNYTIDFNYIANQVDTPIASARFYVPDNHNGVVFFSGKVRALPDEHDLTGTLSLWVVVDRGRPDQRVGPKTLLGYWIYQWSMRTMTASLLVDQSNPLTAGGWHTVELFGRADGTAGGPAVMAQDLPLVWFD